MTSEMKKKAVAVVSTAKLTPKRRRRRTLLSGGSGFSSAASVLLLESSNSKRHHQQQQRHSETQSGDKEHSDLQLQQQHRREMLDPKKEDACIEKDDDDNAVVEEVEILLTVLGWKYYKDDFDKKNAAGAAGGPIEPVVAEHTPVSFQREPRNAHDPNAIAAHAAFHCSDDDDGGKEPDDTNTNTNSNRSFFRDNKKIGHVRAPDAARLAPLLDAGTIRFGGAAHIRACFPSSFSVAARVAVVASSKSSHAAALLALEPFQQQKQNADSARTVSVQASSTKIAASMVERAAAAPYDTNSLKALPWNPLPQTTSSIPSAASKSLLSLGGDSAPMPPSWSNPFDASQWDPLTAAEIRQASSAWPPSDSILLRLGLAPSSDSSWYRHVAGLLPPSQWIVSGALDVLPCIPASSSQKAIAGATLDGAIHGVTNVWHDETLQSLRAFLHQPRFWCQRSGDALIRAFGGPYVLGQDEGKLKLVRGAPHTELTRRVAMAHNIVYTLVHLTPPAGPGFNTLIFGLNLRGPGFHYHQDAIPSLAAKNAPLVPHQPVVTTVLYECPEHDSGKEVVLWKPLLNFSPAVGGNHRKRKRSVEDASDDNDNNNNGSSSNNNHNKNSTDYLAARAVRTTHSLVHVQRAGLQTRAVHGIFHAPNTTTGGSGGPTAAHATATSKSEEEEEPRQGYRVAITARITRPDAAARVRHFEHQSYCAAFGPQGTVGLPPLL